MLGKLRRAKANPAPYVHKWLRVLTRKDQLPLSWRLWLGQRVGTRTASRFRSLYVVTYGRSGSTLTTSYLSHLPGIDLKGENYLFPLPGYEAEQRLVAARTKPYGHRDETTSPWYGAHKFDREVWRRDLLHAMLNQLYPQQLIPPTIGFKEIRWDRGQVFEEFDAVLQWLTSLRAPGGVVFLKRDLNAVMKSAWWAEKTADEQRENRQRLTELEAKMDAYQTTHPGEAITITYEAFTSGPEEAARLCAWLGLPFDESVWRATLDAKHSYQPGDRKDSTAETSN